jgi:nucleoside-diphosphate-sugar epimerase
LRKQAKDPIYVVVGDGFIGRHVAAAFVERRENGHRDVFVLSRKVRDGSIHPEVPVWQMDATDTDDVFGSLQRVRQAHGKRPIVIVHAAGMARPGMAEVDPEEARRQNVLSMRNLAEVSRAIGYSTLVMLSTCYVFNGVDGTARGVYDEPDPIQVYGNTKAEAELLADVVLRLPAVYGPLHRLDAAPSSGLFLARQAHAILQNVPIADGNTTPEQVQAILQDVLRPDGDKVHTLAGQRMQFADVESVAGAVVTLATSVAAQSVTGLHPEKVIVHAAPSEALSWKELVQIFAKTMRPDLRLNRTQLDALVLEDFTNPTDTAARPANPLLDASSGRQFGIDLPGASVAASDFLRSVDLLSPGIERGKPLLYRGF